MMNERTIFALNRVFSVFIKVVVIFGITVGLFFKPLYAVGAAVLVLFALILRYIYDGALDDYDTSAQKKLTIDENNEFTAYSQRLTNQRDMIRFWNTVATERLQVIRQMQDLLIEVADVFREYAKHHQAKTPPDIEKFMRNLGYADRIDALLKRNSLDQQDAKEGTTK